MMNFSFRIFLIIIFLSLAEASLTLSKVVMRPPKENDIGLIFDISVKNSNDNNQRDRLQFSIRAAKPCKLELGNNTFMDEAGHIVGGYFGCVEPGGTETVSIIWPTLSLYNRIGSCPIVITATNTKDEQFHIKQTINIDTKFETLDPKGTGLRKSRNYKDCRNFDLDYLNNCKPVNCGKRYFGLRNFFSECTKRCEPTPACEDEVLYDPFTNDCVDPNCPISKKDIKDIKRGDFKNYQEWTNEIAQNMKGSGASLIKREITNIEEASLNEAPTAKHSNWLKGILDGLMLVFATIGIYVFICFCIFLIVAAISRRQGEQASLSLSAAPSVSERGIPIRARSSIIGRR